MRKEHQTMKQGNTTKLNVKLRREILLLCIILIFAFFVGCSSFEKEEQSDPMPEETLESTEEPFTIFNDGTGYYLLSSFQEKHPEINIRLVNCLPNTDIGFDTFDMNEVFEKNGTPDLIVASDEFSIYLSEMYDEGHIAELGELCSNDNSIDTDVYFPGTFEVFRENDNLLALPLGIVMDFMLTSESKYNESAFSRLEEGYTGRELLSILREEVEKEKESGEFFSESNSNVLLSMYYLGGVTQTEDGIEIDEELFKLVYEYKYKQNKIADEAREFWGQQGKDINDNSGYIAGYVMDPRRYDGNVFAIEGLEDAPAQVLSYAETAYQYILEEGVKAVYYPTADDGNKYQARVRLWGAVAAESSRKELAYTLLRELMDEAIDSFGGPWGIGKIPKGASRFNVNVYPVNKENAISLLERFENQSVKLIYDIGGSNDKLILDRTDVDEVEKEKHAEMLSNISGLFCWDKELQKIGDICFDYYSDYITDYTNCYIETMNALNNEENPSHHLEDKERESNEEGSTEEITNESDETEESEEVKALKASVREVEIGETFFFGTTEQDNNLNNGAEPIEWIVLEKEADKTFVISKKILEWLTFSKYDKGNDKDFFSWDIEENQQRMWLTNELYQNGFSEIEKEIILVTHREDGLLRYDELDDYDDYLYIPSKEDVEEYMPDINIRKAEMTAYIAEKADKLEGEFGSWSLQTMLSERAWKYTRQIKENGDLGATYTFVPNGVRPVMWLDIS